MHLNRWLRAKLYRNKTKLERSKDHIGSSESDFICMDYTERTYIVAILTESTTKQRIAAIAAPWEMWFWKECLIPTFQCCRIHTIF